MKIEGETSKEYLESIKKYMAENPETRDLFANAQKPEHAIKRTNTVTNATVLSLRSDLATYLSDFTSSCAARAWEFSDIDRRAFRVMIKTLCTVHIIDHVTFAVLVRIIDLARSYAPECGLSFIDADKLLRMYFF